MFDIGIRAEALGPCLHLGLLILPLCNFCYDNFGLGKEGIGVAFSCFGFCCVQVRTYVRNLLEFLDFCL